MYAPVYKRERGVGGGGWVGGGGSALENVHIISVN